MKRLFFVFFLFLVLNTLPVAAQQVPPGPPGDTASVFNTEYNVLASFKPSQYVSTGINLLLGAVGIAAFIYLIWGGIQWVTAGSDKEAYEKARKRILHAMIGLALTFSSYTLILIIQILFGLSIIWIPLGPIGNDPPPMPTYAPPPTRTPTTPPGGPTPTPIVGTGSCACDNWGIVGDSCDPPGAAVCTLRFTCACLVPTPPPGSGCVGIGGINYPVGTCSVAPPGGCYNNPSATYCLCTSPGNGCNNLTYDIWCGSNCGGGATPTPIPNTCTCDINGTILENACILPNFPICINSGGSSICQCNI